MAAVHRQKLSRTEDANVPKGPELPKVPIPGDQDIGSGLKSAFEDTIVRLIVLDDMNWFLGLDEVCEIWVACNGLSGSHGRPLELGKQNPFDLFKDRRGD